MGDIEPSEPLFNAFINRSTYEEKFMENGAQPSGVMTLKEKVDDPAEWAKLKSWWNTEYGGKKNAGKTAFLQGEWEYHKLGLDQQAMQSLEREKLTVEQIFINHGVPLSIAGILGAANYATAKQDELNFRKYEIVPLLEMFCGKLNREGALFPLFKNNTQLAYELSGLVDVEQVTKEYGPLLRLGAITPNEIRKLAGLNPVNDPYLDQYFIDSMLSPMEMAGLATVPPAPAPSKSADYRKLKLS
jgi:HK97 family phage portal protein